MLTTGDIASIKDLSIDQLEEKTKQSIDNFIQNDQYGNNYTGRKQLTLTDLHNSMNKQGHIVYDEKENEGSGIIYYLDNDNNIKVLVKLYTESGHGKAIQLLDIK